jgi:hypothetical protein
MFFDKSPYAKRQKGVKRPIDITEHAPRVRKPIEFFTDIALAASIGSTLVVDTETYLNLFFVGFKCVTTGRVICFERSPEFELDCDKLRYVLYGFRTIGFNTIKYDFPLIFAALAGYNNEQLKQISDGIILEDKRVTDIQNWRHKSSCASK